jgi:hypothetical protein
MATLLVGNGGYSTIQAAIDAANDGDTIIIAAGTYDENPIVNKAVTIQGAQAGVAGTARDAASGAGETNVTGEFSITASGNVTIDGIRIVNDTVGGAPSVDVISTGSTGHTITNSIIYSTVQGGNAGDIGIAVRPGTTGTVTISNNAITGSSPGAFGTASFERGIFFDGGGRNLVVTGNLFERTRAGMNLDIFGTSQVTVSDNTFRTAGTGITVSQNASGLTALNNDVQQVGDDFSFRNTTSGVTFDAGVALDSLTPVGNGNDLIVVLGGSGADNLTGSEYADYIDGNNSPTAPNAADADTLKGMAGDDQLFGRGGNDILDGGADRDTVHGNEGDDTILTSSGVDFVFGDAGTDTLVVDFSASTAGVFVDESRLVFGNDTDGGTQGEYSNGVDTSVDFRSIEIFDVTTGSGNDSIRTGAGNDRIVLNAGNDTADAGAGNDNIDGGAGSDTLNGGAGNDRIVGGDGNDTLTGGTGDDVVLGGNGADLIVLQDGGDDVVSGGADNDRFFFGATLTAADVVVGGTGDDAVILQGNYALTLGADTLDGVERIRLLSGDTVQFDYQITTVDSNVAAGTNLRIDALDLKVGEDVTFNGGAETDGTFEILSGAGNDTLVGGAKNDVIFGGAGNDQLFGLGGNDLIIGGGGTDQLRGGGGNDVFRLDNVFHSTVAAPDKILDFQQGSDKIDVSGIDANTTVAGDQAFIFISSANFSGHAGELRSTFDTAANAFRVEGDIDGDGNADFAILVNSFNTPLVSTDFML